MSQAQERRDHWYLLTGLLLGIGLGLLYAWLLSPVEYVDTEPSSLAEVYKDEYRKVIALAYQANQDIGRARDRAALLDPENPARSLAAQAQRLIAANDSSGEARALAVLAADLGQQPPAPATGSSPTALSVAEAPSQTAPAGDNPLPSATLDQSQAIQTATAPQPSITPTVTQTPLPTFTPRPTATPPKVQEAPFALATSQEVCDAAIQPGLLQVDVTDSAGQPLPGVRILVTWAEGEDAFFTGLSPEVGPGYADFQMQPGVAYAIKVGEASEAYKGFQTSGNCGWRLSFTQN